MKQTINTTEIKQGDRVVGFNSKVSSIQISSVFVKVIFENGETWNTNKNFSTTVIR